jgi:hypothetical protein
LFGVQSVDTVDRCTTFYLLAGPMCLRCLVFHSIRGPLLGAYPKLSSPWAKKRLLITSSSWHKKSAWVKLGWRFLRLGLR